MSGEIEKTGKSILLAEGQQVLLVAKVVVEIADVHLELGGDFAHTGGVEPSPSEDTRGRFEDLPLAPQGLDIRDRWRVL
jgi:hypothetical protein